MDNLEPASASNTQNGNTLTEVHPAVIDGGPRVTIDQLIMAGAHFGHLTQRWNPKMKKYIFTSRNGIYLIDLMQTQDLIEQACKKIAQIAKSGDEILFVGTKKSARDIIETEASRAECPYVSYRWLGGTLTNFSTIRKSIKSMETLEKMATDGTYESISKKEQLTVEREKEKLKKTLGGIRDLRRLPGAIFIVDTKREDIAVAEARKLNIPIFAIVDTNVDPDLVDFPIPANDDAYKSIWLVTRAFADAIMEGRQEFKDKQPQVEKSESDDRPRSKRPRRRRRSRRPPDRGDQPVQGGNESHTGTADNKESSDE